eukprot:TRINITY_DN19096_c0_g1_i1.p1 TRINITY_DN19096_c0_g1~~TRINITY_DN19096_c0_g1_i1.p1  ORF type:complete len:206 (+),score=27.88 TRINITY_DN19096_c0_g1_i1:36-653(+)
MLASNKMSTRGVDPGCLCCGSCQRPGCTLKCSKCATTYYCSQACQVKDWNSRHKQLCKIIQRENAALSSFISSHSYPSYDAMMKTLSVPPPPLAPASERKDDPSSLKLMDNIVYLQNPVYLDPATPYDDDVHRYCQELYNILLGKDLARIVEIGNHLDKKGGFQLMQSVHTILQHQSPLAQDKYLASCFGTILKRWWNGVGQWRM